MYFEDLDLCTYHEGMLDAASWAVPLRAVGWLEHGHEFAVGVLPETLVSRIEKLLGLFREHFRNMGFRGLHECSLCRAKGREVQDSGSWQNLLVPGKNEVFAVPGTLIHYIADHSYLPPVCFLEAVASCPDPGSPRYLEALRDANTGLEPPVESDEAFRAATPAPARRGRPRAFSDSLDTGFVECVCGIHYNPRGIPDKGWVAVRVRDYETFVEAEVALAGRESWLDSGDDVHRATAARITARLCECPDCGALAWLSGGDAPARFFKPFSDT